MKTETISNNVTTTNYLNASGDVEYGMTNDYIFRIVLQENKFALKGLLCSILHLEEDSITKIDILNTVNPGESISEKEYRMDIRITLNNATSINLEMQLRNYFNWENRSLFYLCREFDTINHGEDYSEVKPVYQIGFLDFTLFDDHPEFFATYQMRNKKDGHLYTANFNLIVISLNQIELATDEDIACGIDKWARLFKSKTWEELKMVASDNKYMTSAAESLYLSNADENLRKVAREREEFLKFQAFREKKIEVLEETVDSLNGQVDNLTCELKKYKDKYGEI